MRERTLFIGDTLCDMKLVVDGASLQCSFGTSPGTLGVLPVSPATGGGKPIASIMDNVPMLNIRAFGHRTTPSNPMVAAATAAALGVLTPMPCIPVTVSPWIPGNQTVVLHQIPAVDESCTLMCNWGGSIKVQDAKQDKLNGG